MRGLDHESVAEHRLKLLASAPCARDCSSALAETGRALQSRGDEPHDRPTGEWLEDAYVWIRHSRWPQVRESASHTGQRIQDPRWLSVRSHLREGYGVGQECPRGRPLRGRNEGARLRTRGPGSCHQAPPSWRLAVHILGSSPSNAGRRAQIQQCAARDAKGGVSCRGAAPNRFMTHIAILEVMTRATA